MKTNLKAFFRLFTKHITRFFTIVAIVLVSVGFMAGVLEIESKIDMVENRFYQNQNVSDLYLKSKNASGFSLEEKEQIKNMFAYDEILESFSYEREIDDKLTRIYYFDLDNMNVNKLKLLEGNMPETANEVLVERKTNKIKSYDVGDVISIDGIPYTVSGIVLNPLIIIKEEEPSFTDANQCLKNVIYFNVPALPMVNDIYIALENRNLFNTYSEEYKTQIKHLKGEINQNFSADSLEVLTLYDNVGLYSLSLYSHKVSLIGIIFVFFFFLIEILVIYSTMSRLLTEERAKNACLKTLGYSDWKIISNYIGFVVTATFLGGLLSYMVGFGLTSLLYSAFNIQYTMPAMPMGVSPVRYIIIFAITLVVTTILTSLTTYYAIKQKPVTLLTPKAPKQGRKVLLEKIPIIWNRLSFKYKSTVRNVFLFRSRFIMTFVSILGATVLVLAGFGIMNCAMKDENTASLVPISIALIAFSAVLCALVIYNLTNINVSERNREIATLMVLGYTNKEVSGYIFREIYLMSAFGALLGLPIGYGFLVFLFDVIDFGTIADVSWWTWIVSPLATMLFTFLSTRLLYHKIVSTDMNKSLKSLE